MACWRRLREARVGLLIDVRAVAASRKPGFSKRQLAAGLDQVGIGYVHLQRLGTPKPGRDAVRAGHPERMVPIFNAHMETPEAQLALAEAKAHGGGATVLPVVFRTRPSPLPSSSGGGNDRAETGQTIEHLEVPLCRPAIAPRCR